MPYLTSPIAREAGACLGLGISASASHHWGNVSVQSFKQCVREENLEAFHHKHARFCGISCMKPVGRPTNETISNHKRPTAKAIKNGINISLPASNVCGRNMQCTVAVWRGAHKGCTNSTCTRVVSAFFPKKCGHGRKCEACWKKTIFMTEEIWPHITVIMNKIFSLIKLLQNKIWRI